MTDPETFSTDSTWTATASAQHPPDVQLDEHGNPVLDEDGNPAVRECDQ